MLGESSVCVQLVAVLPGSTGSETGMVGARLVAGSVILSVSARSVLGWGHGRACLIGLE